MAMKSNGNESGFVAIILVVVVVLGLAWWGIALLTNKSNDASDHLSTIAKEIESKKVADECTYEDNRDSGAADLLLDKAVTNFVNLAKTIDANTCKSFQYGLFLKTTNDRGEESNTSVLTLRLDEDNRSRFNSYNWEDLENQSIGEKLKSDGIITKINLNVEGVALDKVSYKGSKEELQ